jgi:sugar/nucleoside kinase (ribokinase family)
VPALRVENPADATGAGDYWAAGFLFGLARGLPLAECARIGALLGAHVVQYVGASLPDETWARIMNHIERL